MTVRHPRFRDRTGAADKTMLTLLGAVAFVVAWLGAAGVWGVVSLMGGLTAGDAGRVSPEHHANLFLLLLVGEVLVAMAGFVGAMALVLTERRATLWATFATLLVLGGAIQGWAVWTFRTLAGD